MRSRGNERLPTKRSDDSLVKWLVVEDDCPIAQRVWPEMSRQTKRLTYKKAVTLRIKHLGGLFWQLKNVPSATFDLNLLISRVKIPHFLTACRKVEKM